MDESYTTLRRFHVASETGNNVGIITMLSAHFNKDCASIKGNWTNLVEQ